MSDNTPIADKAIYKVFIAAPIEVVWRELVKTDEVLPFFFGSGVVSGRYSGQGCGGKTGASGGMPASMTDLLEAVT